MGRYSRRRPASLDLNAKTFYPASIIHNALVLPSHVPTEIFALFGSLPFAALLPVIVRWRGQPRHAEACQAAAAKVVSQGSVPGHDLASYVPGPWSRRTLRAKTAREVDSYLGFSQPDLLVELSQTLDGTRLSEDLVRVYEASIILFKVRYGLDLRGSMRTAHLLDAQLWSPLDTYLRHLEDRKIAEGVKPPRRLVRETLLQHRASLDTTITQHQAAWFAVEEELAHEFDPDTSPSDRYLELKAQVQLDLRRTFHALTRYPTVVEDTLMARGVPSASLLIGGSTFEERTVNLHAAQATHEHPELDTLAGCGLSELLRFIGAPAPA